MRVPEILGWVALVLNVWGNLALTRKNKAGWTIRIVSNLAWLIYSFFVFAWPLFVNHVIFCYINILGWVTWSRGEKDKLR